MRVSYLWCSALVLPLSLHAAVPGDANRGEQLANQCFACHGNRGAAPVSDQFPRIDGQSADYLAKQLHDFTTPQRQNPTMTPLASGLSAQAIADLSAYYASYKNPSANTPAKPAAAVLKRGETLAALGDARLGVQGCGNCHGVNGAGEPPAIPYLAGQSAAYMQSQLEAWQHNARSNDGGAQMKSIATRLGKDDITALSAYFAQLNSPRRK